MVSWNHMEFRVTHPSLASEPRVGNYYLRLLLEEDKRFNEVIDAATVPNGDIQSSSASDQVFGLSRIRDR